MYKRLKSFIDSNGILFSGQYGFRDKHSTQHALLDIVNAIQENIDHNVFSCGIFLDFKNSSLLSHGQQTWPLVPGPPRGRMSPKDRKAFLASEGHYVQMKGRLRRF